ncbi:MAG: hypothetical protein ACTII7_12045 [Galactobacter sp.]
MSNDPVDTSDFRQEELAELGELEKAKPESKRSKLVSIIAAATGTVVALVLFGACSGVFSSDDDRRDSHSAGQDGRQPVTLDDKLTHGRYKVVGKLDGKCEDPYDADGVEDTNAVAVICTTQYGPVIVFVAADPDVGRNYLTSKMGAGVDAWEDDDVFFVADPEVLELLQ